MKKGAKKIKNKFDMKKFLKKYGKTLWVISTLVSSILGFLVGVFLTDKLMYINHYGFHILGGQFTSFDYYNFGRFQSQYIYPQNTTQLLTIGSNWKNDLVAVIDIKLEPQDPEIKITCKEQNSGLDCMKGIPIKGGSLVVLEFSIVINDPKQEEYTFCLKTIDGSRDGNYRIKCKELIMIKKDIGG